MKTLVVGLTILCMGSGSLREANDATTVKVAPPRCLRVGQLTIVGNTRTKQSVILNQVGLQPGEIIQGRDILKAEIRLTRLGIFKCLPAHPTVEVRDDPNCPANEYKDVIIHVEEDNTTRVSFAPVIGCKGACLFHVLFEERNLDPSRWPTSWEDIVEGRAFRGAGMTVSLEVQFTVPFSTPCLPLVFRVKEPVSR